MVLFSLGVIRQKVPLPPKVLVSLGVSKYFLSGFAVLLGLFLKPLGLCVEFHSASIGAIFTRGHQPKSATCAQNTGSPWGFSRYLLSRFAILLALFLKPLGLDAKFNSSPNPGGLRSNPSNIANPDRKYLEIPRKTSLSGTSGSFCPMIPS
jgi:hypothetical protein